MSTDSFKVKNSLNIGPKSTAGTEAGDLRVDSADSNKLKYHDGSTEDSVVMQTALDATEADLAAHEADTSVHGVTGAVVGTTDTQTLTNKTVGVADGTSSAPSVNFTADTNTGLYRSTTDTLDVVAGGYTGLQIKKATGNYANLGMGGNASVLDAYPIALTRNHNADTIVQVSNPNGGSSSSARILVKGDTGNTAGVELALYPAASSIHAYTGRAVVRATDGAVGLSLGGGTQASSDVRVYTSGVASTNEVARFNADKSTDLNGDLTVTGTAVDLGNTNTATTVNIGTGTGANTINIGGADTTINMTGTVNNQNVTNLEVSDKLITINSGGAAASGAVAGIEVEEDGSATGYVYTSADRNSWEFKAPNTAGVASLTPGGSADEIALLAKAQTLTNKTIDASSNTISNIGTSQITSGAATDGYVLTADGAGAVAWEAGGINSASITGQTEDTTPAQGDFLLTSDTSASGALKKIQIANLFTNSASGSGYTYLPGGILLQWLTGGASSGGTTTNFPIAFPTAVWNLQATAQNQVTGIQAVAPNTSQVTLTVASGTPNCYIFAIGN